MKTSITRTSSTFLGAMALGLSFPITSNAQVVLEEHFTGGTSTTGFTIVSVESDCDWIFAPGGLTENMFSVDAGGSLPTGGGFDGDFAFLDSDACGATDVVVNSTLISPAFDASSATVLNLSFSHQFRARLESFGKVDVYDGTTWTEVALYTGDNVGYPNPAAEEIIDITDAAGGSAAAQVRFQFSAGWDWWWALDNIVVTAADCAYPSGLAANNITTTGATFSWQDNGSTGYEWVVTAGGAPDGSNTIANGDGSNMSATGLNSGTSYAVFIRSLCPGGGTSSWSTGVPFTTLITNDECSGAIGLTVNTDYECMDITPATIAGATASNITTTCFGTPDDDVWFSFTALTATHRISLLDIAGSTGDLYHALWTGSCEALTLVENSCSDPESSDPVALVAGQVYYLQVYSWTGIPDQNSTFNVCIGSDPSIGIQEQGTREPLSVFPNPVHDDFTLSTAIPNAHHFDVMDALGRRVSQHAVARTIDVQGLTTGTYVLLVVDRTGAVLSRTTFVKE
ncbi:MAG: T9SS type A sorting domain-containing protein [Flavobacteriales bacterium]|nr:T9SS type A sorting domain-containing protein [Flavobacteriales bacterium]HRH69256.1 T9SS type A sorting domain-containing protein [Flavobacteriales bacterium]